MMKVSTHGQRWGRATNSTTASPCRATEACTAHVGFQRLPVTGSDTSVGVRLLSDELSIQKVLPESTPDGPLVTPRHHEHICRLQRGCHHPVPIRKAIFAPVSQPYGHPMLRSRLDETPHPPLIIVRCELAGLPGIDSVGALDLSDDDVVPEVGREQAQAINLGCVTLGECQTDKTAEGYSTQPDGLAPQGPGRQHQLVTHPSQDRPIRQVLQS